MCKWRACFQRALLVQLVTNMLTYALPSAPPEQALWSCCCACATCCSGPTCWHTRQVRGGQVRSGKGACLLICATCWPAIVYCALDSMCIKQPQPCAESSKPLMRRRRGELRVATLPAALARFLGGTEQAHQEHAARGPERQGGVDGREKRERELV